MAESEKHIGNLSSPFLRKGKLWGYGILATDTRLIGYKSARAGIIMLVGPMIAGIGGAIFLIGGLLDTGLLASVRVLILGICTFLGTGILITLILVGPAMVSTKTIHEIERTKDFEIRKDLISEIVMTSPLGFDLGYLTVSLKSGQTINVSIAHRKVFRKTIELMRAFYPEVREFPSR